MQLRTLLLIITSLMLCITSAWTLSTFMRLDVASQKYSDSSVFDSACHVTKSYVTLGRNMGVITAVVSVIILILSSFTAYAEVTRSSVAF